MTYPAPTRRRLPARPDVRGASLFMGVWVVLLWFLELVDAAVPGLRLDSWGVSPRDPAELPQIFTAPLLHVGWQHLAANTIPFFVLGLVILLSGIRPFLVATLASVVVSGAFVWLFSAPGTVTLGASGVVFGWLAFVLVRGVFSGNVRHLLVGVVMFLVYGGVLWGVLPTASGISWQGHLGGAVGGVLAAWWLNRRPDAPGPS